MSAAAKPKKVQDGAVAAAAVAAALAAPGMAPPAPYIVTGRIGSATFEKSVAAEATRVDRKQVEDIVALSEAKSDVKFERMLGEMRVGFAELRGEIGAVGAKLNSMPTTFQMVSWMVSVGIAIAGLALAIFRLGIK